MYSNIFDTVKHNDLDMINFEGMLYASILNGLHPTFSLNQAVDSRGLLTLINESESFCKLISNGYIRVAVFGGYGGKHDDISTFLSDKLKQCVDANKASFRFSSMDFLYSGAYEERQLIQLFEKMIPLVKSGTSIDFKDAHDIGLTKDDFDTINAYIFAVHKLENLVWGRFTLHDFKNDNEDVKSENVDDDRNNGKGQKVIERHTDIKSDATRGSLFSKVLRDIRIYLGEVTDIELKQCLKDFRMMLFKQKNETQFSQKLNSRSNMYAIIEELKCSEDQEKELKALVDLCYNEVVAESIVDNEDDIMVNSNNYQYAQVYAKNSSDTIAKVNQKLALVRNAEYSGKVVFSWDLLYEMLNEANRVHTTSKNWYEIMTNYCEQIGMENANLGKQMVLRTTIDFVSAILRGVTSGALIKRLKGIINDEISELLISSVITSNWGLAKDIMKDAVPTFSLFPSIPERKKLIKDIQENNAKRSDLKLLTQLSLLKRDYNK